MHQTRKDMSRELQALQERLRALLRANMGEARRTKALLQDTERKVEEQLGHLDFIETAWYVAGKKFRKEPVEKAPQNDGFCRNAEQRVARTPVNTPNDTPRSTVA